MFSVASKASGIKAPTNAALPMISGTMQTGSVLTTTNGVWRNNPTSYTYQWNRGLNPISGATAPGYLVTSNDTGYTITVMVYANNIAGVGSASSSATVAITELVSIIAPVNTSLPVISGLSTQGSTLTATTGSWNNTPTSYAYQWNRNGSAISGATSSNYVLTETDVGKFISVSVIANNSGGTAVAVSNITSPISAL